MPNLNNLVLDSFSHGKSLAPFELNRRLRNLYSDQAVLVTNSYSFDLTTFRDDGKCMIWELDDLDSLIYAEWFGRDKGTQMQFKHAFFEVLWNHHHFKCLQCEIDYEPVSFIIAESEVLAHRLFEEVSRYSQDSGGRVIVFSGAFHREPELEKAVQSTSWEDLVLPEAMKRALWENVTGFFESKELYEKYGLPWKRGVMFYGPPGNGKTHAIKALIKASNRPCLIVKSFRMRYELTENVVNHVFERARQMAPAIIVFEDIDSLIERSNLSSLLNEMDGFAKNDGLLCLATTNHLEKLDDALAKRPSRFDRKFEFPNPKKGERILFLEERFAKLDPAMRPSRAAILTHGAAAKGFSGAMLQELIGSCTMSWIQAAGDRSMDDVLATELDSLKPKPVKQAC